MDCLRALNQRMPSLLQLPTRRRCSINRRLPDFIERLRHPGLAWICAFHYVHDGRATGSRRNPRGGITGQKLLLV